MGGKLRPCRKSVLAGDRQLCVGKFKRGVLNIEVRQTLKARMMIANPLQCFRFCGSSALDELFRLLLVLLDIGAGRKPAIGHTKLLSMLPESA
jgi:hypothetical protein